MSPEQTKQLKKGDEIFIRSTFIKTDISGDIEFSVKYRGRVLVDDSTYSISENVFLPSDLQQLAEKPKYDPCRPFKKGDKVEYYPRNGRDFFDMPWVYDAASVIEDEYRSGMVVVRFTFNYGGPSVHKVPWYYLQLVTPVEEMEPYSVGESTDYFSVDKDDEELCLYWKDKHPHAKKSAEAERDRLNAKHRKGAK